MKRIDQADIDRALDQLGALRGECPPVEVLMSHADGDDSSPRRELLEHLELCPFCTHHLQRMRSAPPPIGDLEWQRSKRNLDQKDAPWRRSRRWRGAYVAAVAALVGIAVGLFWLTIPSSDPDARVDPTIRGAEFAGVSPKDRTDGETEFVWTPSPLAARYRVTVRRGDEIIWSETTTGHRIASPPMLLQSGVVYRWQVAALTDTDLAIDTSDWTQFTVVGD